MSPTRQNDARLRQSAAGVFVAALLLLGIGLGAREIEDRSEARIPVVALDILRTGRLLPPYILGEPYLNKPPLHHLLAAGAIRLFGRHDEFVVRLPSVLCGALAITLTFWIAARVAGVRAGLSTAAFLFLSYKFFALSRSAELEILLAAGTAIGYLGIAAALWPAPPPPTAEESRRGWWVAALGVAIACLAKGPAIALIFPFVLLAADAVVTRSSRRLLSMGPLILLLGAALGTGAYYGPLALKFGGIDALRERLAFGNVLHLRGFHYYLWQLPLGLLPAGLLLPWMIAGLRRAGQIERTCALAVGFGIVGFSFSASKQSHYLLPFYPLVAIWGGMVARTLRSWLLTAMLCACLAPPIVTMVTAMVERSSSDARPAKVLRTFSAAAASRPLAMRERHPVVAYYLDRSDLEIRETIAAATNFLDERSGALVIDLEKNETLPPELGGYPAQSVRATDGHTYMLLEGR